jgi:hypothetical protein
MFSVFGKRRGGALFVEPFYFWCSICPVESKPSFGLSHFFFLFVLFFPFFALTDGFAFLDGKGMTVIRNATTLEGIVKTTDLRYGLVLGFFFIIFLHP